MLNLFGFILICVLGFLSLGGWLLGVGIWFWFWDSCGVLCIDCGLLFGVCLVWWVGCLLIVLWLICLFRFAVICLGCCYFVFCCGFALLVC